MRATWRPRSRAASASRSWCTTSTRPRPERWPRSSAARRSARTPRWPSAPTSLVLCHKPKQLDEVASEVGGRAKVVVSILAATADASGSRTSIRGRRSTASSRTSRPRCSEGVLCYVPGRRAADGPEEEILELFGRTGTVIRARRRAADRARDGADGCGPGFLALVAESFADAGGRARPGSGRRHADGGRDDGRHGRLPRARTTTTARRSAARVATPGGTTERGLIALEEHGLRRRDARGRGRRGGGHADERS